MPKLNPLVENTASPPIPQVQAWGAAYRGGRGALIDLCQAVPGYPPAPGLLEQLRLAGGRGDLARYGLIGGDPALREAYAQHLSTLHDAPIGADQVAITAGCNQAFFAALLTLAEPGGAVLLPQPFYYNHEMTCRMLGLEARALPCSEADGFVPDPRRAESLLDARVRAIVLVTPNNPTGAIYPAATIAAFAALCRRRGIALILDETYRDFLPAGRGTPHDLLTDPDWGETVVQLYSFSKAYAVPGQRLGALAASPAVLTHLMKALDCLHICPQRPGQTALAWALPALADWRDANRAEMNHRAAVVRRCFAAIPHWRIDSLGAYFAYVHHPFADLDDWQVVELLAREHGVMLLPASPFAGSPRHVRISFANVGEAGIESLAARLAGVAVAAPAAA